MIHPHYWHIRLPKNFAANPPRFHFGDFVPLGDRFQLGDGVIWFGRVRSIMFDGESFFYAVTVPKYHPEAWFADGYECYSENEIAIAIQRYEV